MIFPSLLKLFRHILPFTATQKIQNTFLFKWESCFFFFSTTYRECLHACLVWFAFLLAGWFTCLFICQSKRLAVGLENFVDHKNIISVSLPISRHSSKVCCQCELKKCHASITCQDGHDTRQLRMWWSQGRLLINTFMGWDCEVYCKSLKKNIIKDTHTFIPRQIYLFYFFI